MLTRRNIGDRIGRKKGVALFFCRRSIKEPVKARVRRFTIKEIEPFVTIEHREDRLTGSMVAVVIGVAICKDDGTWGVHELSDETGGWTRTGRTSWDGAETCGKRAILEMKRRLAGALNRLADHYERVYVFSTKLQQIDSSRVRSLIIQNNQRKAKN